MSLPKFAPPRSFYAALKRRAAHYFQTEAKTQTGNTALLVKALLLVAGQLALYVHLVGFTPAPGWALLECAAFGLSVALVGFNVMHDGAPGSFSRYSWLNRTAAYTLSVLGGSGYMWDAKHNGIHHMYTNIDGVDDDLDIQPWMRLTADQKLRRLHRYQHLYFWVFYCLLLFSWVFVLDYQKYFTRRIGSVPITAMSVADHSVFCSLYPSRWRAVVSHVLFLRQMGRA